MKLPPDKKIWYPTLLQSSNLIKSNSWFNIIQKENPIQNDLKEISLNINYIKTMKFPIYPNKEQHQILQSWFQSVIKMYNITNNYIKTYYEQNKKIETYITIRKKLLKEANNLKKDDINKHILDYSIKHCFEMYKAAISNLKAKNIKEFNIKDLEQNRIRYNLVLEPASFSKNKNGFCIKVLKEMKSQKSLIGLVNKNSVLQYNRETKRYFLIVPFDKTMNQKFKKKKKCGIDMGVRTFATVYSDNHTLEIGSNLMNKIDMYHARMDNLKSNLDQKLIKESLYQKVLLKYGNQMINRISDFHKKVSVYLSKKFEIINLEKVSIKAMISNLQGDLQTKTKRRLVTLGIYQFYQTIQIQSKKYGTEIKLIHPFKTSMTCHNCLNEKKNLGCNKVYKCDKCKIELDRDINAAINIYNGGFKSL